MGDRCSRQVDGLRSRWRIPGMVEEMAYSWSIVRMAKRTAIVLDRKMSGRS